MCISSLTLPIRVVDGSPDPTLSQFNIDKSPKRWAVLQDIKVRPNGALF